MKISRHILFIAAIFSMAIGAAQSQVIFTDTFDSGTGAWYIGSTLNQGADSTIANASGELQFTLGDLPHAQNKDEIIGRSFTETSIAVGQTIRMTWDFRQTSATAILRAGLFDRSATAITADGWAYTTSGTGSGTYAGYSTFFRDNSATGNVARAESSSFTNGDTTGYPTGSSGLTTITNPGPNIQQFDINDDGTVIYKALFEVTRTDTGVATLFSLSSGATTHLSVTGVHTTATPFTTFDTAILRLDTGTGFFDNIQVEVTPDLSTPSTFQLVITPNASNYDFSWDSLPGKFYDLITSTDLATPIADWPVYDPDGPGDAAPLGNISSAGNTTTLTAVPSSDPRRFFAIREK